MVASISANHGSHFFKNLKRGDNHPTKNSNPSCTAIIYTLPTSHGLPIRSNLTRPTSYWLPLPTSPSNPTYPTGIYTLYIMSLTFFIHLPMKMEPIRSSETSAIKTQDARELPKKEHITVETWRKLENSTNCSCNSHCTLQHLLEYIDRSM